jgi:hypothetical protein
MRPCSPRRRGSRGQLPPALVAGVAAWCASVVPVRSGAGYRPKEANTKRFRLIAECSFCDVGAPRGSDRSASPSALPVGLRAWLRLGRLPQLRFGRLPWPALWRAFGPSPDRFRIVAFGMLCSLTHASRRDTPGGCFHRASVHVLPFTPENSHHNPLCPVLMSAMRTNVQIKNKVRPRYERPQGKSTYVMQLFHRVTAPP